MATRLTLVRAGGVLAALVLLGWIAYQTVHAGYDVPPPMPQQQTRLTGGSASGKRIDGKSWSLDYETATMSADGSVADIDRVHDGVIYRNGRPYMHMQAGHVTANLTFSTFTVTGPVSFTQVGGQRRTLKTIGAEYSGADHILHLDNPTVIHDGSATITVQKVTINFQTGATVLGRIVGTM